MLEHIREKAAVVMAQVETATLTTCGPADIQSDALPCHVLNRKMYLLVMRTSDQLLNLEHLDGVLVTAAGWQLRGTARILSPLEVPVELIALQFPRAEWSVWVEIAPLRLTLFDADKKWFETIDF